MERWGDGEVETYHTSVGEVELPGLFEDHVLTLLPLGVLVL